MKKGFMSISIVYSFLIVFLLLLFAIVASYLTRVNLLGSILNDAKDNLYEGYASSSDGTQYNLIDNSHANNPKLASGMTPIVYDNETDTWITVKTYPAGDFNKDGVVSSDDTAILNTSSCYGSTSYTDPLCTTYDVNLDGSIDSNDLDIVTSCMGESLSCSYSAYPYYAPQLGWYNYSKLIWANAAVLYTNYPAGSHVNMQDIKAMYVWIPRYEYPYLSMGTNYAGGTRMNVGALAIRFIPGVSTVESAQHIIHPVFRNGSIIYTNNLYTNNSDYKVGGWDKELSGFWFGKFETGSTIKYKANHDEVENNILIKPDVYSMNYMTVSAMYQTALNAQFDHNIGDTLETHMTKPDEWGAVTYLTQSIYGKVSNANYSSSVKELFYNNSFESPFSTVYTGRSSGKPSTSTARSQSKYGKYTYNNCDADIINDCSTMIRNKNKYMGVGASTTGNIYGIYDMVGGHNDQLMANYRTNKNSSNFSILPSKKYLYSYYSNSSINTCNGVCYGQAISETNDWYQDNSNYGSTSSFWTSRGGNSGSSDNIGIYSSFFNSSGYYSSDYSFRISLN